MRRTIWWMLVIAAVALGSVSWAADEAPRPAARLLPDAVQEAQTPREVAVERPGHIAQVAVLPAFAHAEQNSKLAALVSDDPVKLKELGDRYGVEARYSYDDYGECLKSGLVDAVDIALPNDMHCEYSVRAAEAGVHVLCEKPMAVTEEECEEMIAAAETNDV